MYLEEIAATENVSVVTPEFTIKEAIEVIISWCDKNPEKKIVNISWLFTLRCKHLAKALRIVIGILD